MKWAAAQLIKQGSEIFEIHEQLDFSDFFKPSDEIRALSPVKVDGTGQVQGKKVIFRLHLEGVMTLGCALTLDDVQYPFETDATEIFVLDSEAFDPDSEDILVNNSTVELAPVIWQNVFLQKPLRVVKDGAYEELKKQGIELVSEEDLLAEGSDEPPVDPRLAVLSKLLGDKKD